MNQKKLEGKIDAEELQNEVYKKFHSLGKPGRKDLFKTDYDDIKELKKAKKKGTLHEQMLNKREKEKADKFCK